jgi:hypothetical protein
MRAVVLLAVIAAGIAGCYVGLLWWVAYKAFSILGGQ